MKLNVARRGQGKPLVLLHGLFGSSNNWAPLMAALEGGFDLVAPDLRNHGKSPHDADAGVEAMASDIAGLLDALKLERVFLLGHSLGGRVAMRFALDHPGKVERLLVADMAPRAYGPLFPEVFEALASLNLESLQSRAEADERLKEKIADPSMRAFLLTNLARDAKGGFRWKMNLPALEAARPSLRAEIKAAAPYPGPALFLRGEKSNYIEGADLNEIRALFPAAGMESIAGAGHWLHVERPEAFAGAVKKFFS